MPAKMRLSILLFTFVLFFAGFITGSFSHCSPADSVADAEARKAGYVDEKTCYSCHEQAYKDWKGSHHDLAMQVATEESVLGDFNNAVFESDGEQTWFYKKDGKFFVSTEGPDGQQAEFEVLYTFGFTPLQQYITALPGGKLQCLLTAWDSEKKQWFDLQPGQRFKPDDWMHWTKGSMNWNTMCSDCHSTYVRKNYQEESGNFNTKYAFVNVACQSCHGPGKKHNDYIDSKAYKKGRKVKGSYMYMTLQDMGKKQVELCARCHSHRSQVSEVYDHSGVFMDHYVPEILRPELYQADGQILGEVFDYSSFLQSKMYRNGVMCTQCHNAHSMKLRVDGNGLCQSCHDPKKYDTSLHTFHKMDKEGGLCVNCHMPGRVYMGNDFRRDHSFRVPRPDQSEKYGTTNACNDCHTDKSYKWSAEAVRKWYGPQRKPHFSDALVAMRSGDMSALPKLASMIGDTAQPEIVQATIMNIFGDIPSPLTHQRILEALRSKSPVVRYYAVNSMGNFSLQERQQHLIPMLSDSVRSVRAQAAYMLADMPLTALPEKEKKAFQSASKEFETVLKMQADFPTGQLLKGQYFLKKGNTQAAEKAFLEALRQDPYLAQGHLLLANLRYNSGQLDAAEKGFEKVIELQPQYGDAYFWLGLLLAERNKLPEAAKNLEKAAIISKNPRHYYNWGLVLQKMGKVKEAESTYKNALLIDPNSEVNLYALAVLLAQNNRNSEARKVSEKLLKLNPNNATYQALKSQLGYK